MTDDITMTQNRNGIDPIIPRRNALDHCLEDLA